MKKWLKVVLWVVGVLLGLVVLSTILVAPVAKSYVNNHGEELLGRKVHIDELSVNVYTGHLALRRVALYEDNGSDLFVSFDTLDVKIKLLKLLSHTVHLKHLTLAGLDARVEDRGGVFNFQSLIDHFASDTTEEEKDTTPSDWVMKFYNTRISHAQLRYRDVKQHQEWHLPDVNLRVPGFVLGGEETSEGGLNIGFTEGGRLSLQASLDEQQDRYSLSAHLEDFALSNLQPLFADMLRLQRLGGTVDVQLNASGTLGEVMKSRIDGKLVMQRVDLVGGEGSVMSFDRFEVLLDELNLDEGRYNLRSVTLDGLAAKYEQWSDHNTLSDILVQQKEIEPADTTESAVTPDTAAQKSQPLQLHVGKVAVRHCNLTYADYTLPDAFVFPISDINIEATDLRFNGDNNARLRAVLPGGGHLLLDWKGNIDHWKQHQQLFLSIKGLDMKKLSPWTVYYTGQPIEDGIFSLTTRATIRNSQLESHNKLDIYKARVGSRRKDVDPEMKLPLKTALYILKDKDDKILIEMPVSGNIDSPEFNYMKLVWKTLGNLLVKVATSPVRALAGALGAGGEDLDFIDIDPSQRSLTSEQYHTLGSLAKVAQRDTLLVLTLTQQMPPAANDTVAKGYAFRNEVVRRYLIEQGVSAQQIQVLTGEPQQEGGRTGYAISSEMKIDE